MNVGCNLDRNDICHRNVQSGTWLTSTQSAAMSAPEIDPTKVMLAVEGSLCPMRILPDDQLLALLEAL